MPFTVEFGDGTDTDTWVTVFGSLSHGWIISVNGTDMQVRDLYEDDIPGFYGYPYIEGTGVDYDHPFGVKWDDVETLLIY